MKFFLSFLLLTSLSVQANTLEVIDVIEPENSTEDYLVLVSNGEVLELEQSNTEAVQEVLRAQRERLTLEIATRNIGVLSDFLSLRDQISNVRAVKAVERVENTKKLNPMSNYTPTRFNSMDQIQNLFNGMRRDTRRRGECFNRAYGWNYEMWEQHKVNSNKIFIFFSRKYIREYKYKWWFHVAPSLELVTNNGVQDIMLDPVFSRKPLSVREWTNIFMENKANCTTVEHYTQYEYRQETNYCFLMKSSMYYWQPLDLEHLDKKGTPHLDWNEWKVNRSFKDGFKRRWFRRN